MFTVEVFSKFFCNASFLEDTTDNDEEIKKVAVQKWKAKKYVLLKRELC